MIRMKHAVADSSFYILFYADLEDSKSLHTILNNFKMFIGEKILLELKRYVCQDQNFSKLINDVSSDVDFSLLLKRFYHFLRQEFPQYNNWIMDGEFEAMGISYHLKRQGVLNYLIIDDNDARDFAKRELVSLKDALIRTPTFLHKSCVNGDLDREFVISILKRVKGAIERGKSPFYLDCEGWKKYISPIVDDLMEEFG